MKQIGHIDGAATDKIWRTHSLSMLASHALFIPNPGERETVDTEAFEQIGWVNPDIDGGAIYTEHKDAAEHGPARPAYIRRLPQSIHEDGPKVVYHAKGQIDPMDVRRSEFDSLFKCINEIEIRLNRHALLLPKPDEPPIDTELSAHVFQVSTDNLIKEALEFCDSGSGCQREHVYIRELTDRLRSALRPMPAPTIKSEPPMSFYDHAFIAAYMAAPETMNDSLALKQAHNVASILTRNRAVPS